MIYCASIKELASATAAVSDFGLREIAKLESRLRYLSIALRRVTDVGIRYVAKYCGKLRYLNARGCEGITDHGLEYLAKNSPNSSPWTSANALWSRHGPGVPGPELLQSQAPQPQVLREHHGPGPADRERPTASTCRC